MTEKLKDLLHERANRPHFLPPDVDLLVREGAARAHRRRFRLAAAGVVATFVAGGLAIAVAGGDEHAADPADVVPIGGVSWATGSTLHTEEGGVDLGHPIEAYVRSGAGYVFTDGSGSVFSVADGAVERIGEIDDRLPHLVADADGSLVAWVDPSQSVPQFVVYDQANGKRAVFEGPTEPPSEALDDEVNGAYVYAVDDRVVYWRDTRGIVAVDTDSGEVRMVSPPQQSGHAVLSAEDGILAFEAGDAGTAVGTSRADAILLPEAYGAQAAISPHAEWVVVDADDLEVFEVRTGKRIGIDLGDRFFASGYEWIDTRTLAVISAEDPRDPADLLTCDVPTGRCEVTAGDIGTFDELSSGFALPVGSPMGD